MVSKSNCRPAGRTPWFVGAMLAIQVGAYTSAFAQDLELDLRLRDAVPHVVADDAALNHGHTLMVPLRQVSERWERFVAYAGAGPRTVHGGRVSEARATADTIDLLLDMEVAGDYGRVSWDRAKFRVELKRQSDGSYRGTHQGTWQGHKVRGTSDAVVPPPRKTLANHVPVQAGEHPRILFRKGDLPALKEKAKTPFGRAALAKMGGPAALGLKYQLTGEERWAREAAEAVVPLMAKGLHSDKSRGLSERADEIAIGYDCCYAAWPAHLKRLVEDYLARAMRCAFHYHEDFISSGINWHVCSNWSAPLYTAVGFGGLALWGEKGPEPVRPQAPVAEIEIPAAGYAPAEGVPVVPVASAARIRQWLATEPVDLYVEQEPSELGGWANAKPRPGTKFRCGLAEVTFRPLAAQFVSDEGALLMPRYLPAPKGDMSLATVYFYTVLKCGETAEWKMDCPAGDVAKPKVLLGGRQVAHGDLVKLPAGHVPLLVVYLSAARAHVPWTPFGIGLVPATQADRDAAKAALTQRQVEYQESLRDWEYDLAEWKRTGGMNVEYLKLFHKSRTAVYMHYREAVGTGGFQAEVGGYSGNATGPAARYAAAYRTMFGEEVSCYEDISQYVPRMMFAHVTAPAEKGRARSIALDINGTTDVHGLPALLPVIRNEWKPAVLWYWQHLKAGEAEEAIIAADPLRAFLYWPLDMNPKHPQGVMPLTWQAPDFGYYGFRNSWRGKDDFVVQVFLKAHHIRGWSGANAGTFRVFGLDQEWAVGPAARERCRALENVVLLPQDDLNDSACGRLLHASAEKDGSGVVSLDLADVYATRNDKLKEDPYEYYGNGRNPLAFKDSGVKGIRSIGVDYSGLSGAPCLLAVVDRIEGGKRKEWAWQLADGSKGGAVKLPETKVSGNTFTVTKGGATLRGVFASPAQVQIRAEARQGQFENGHSGTVKFTAPAIYAHGADPSAGEFFVVVSIGRGEPPGMKVEGAGPSATVTVGNRRVSFDGQRIVFASAKTGDER